MLAAGIPAAQAGLIAGGPVTAAQPTTVEAATAVAAQAEAVITYPRSDVSTRPADQPAAPAPAATGSTTPAAVPPAAAAAPPAAVAVDPTLRAPLASISISSPFGPGKLPGADTRIHLDEVHDEAESSNTRPPHI
ncbi:hypothetical protein M8J71_02630 [Pseudarthrobacter sp. R1]|uniref:hypothetical protein n=1 Tax=Pseudarthrobacter sp. R1 TaxID=2944934 RepID=UPI00210AFB61|nr:hypothetical protein [Pseudarthrobacter sp. R1]MCQ6269390.1 hypothetical protein [Pseudarthrobacter sp. R1]